MVVKYTIAFFLALLDSGFVLLDVLGQLLVHSLLQLFVQQINLVVVTFVLVC